MFNNGDNMIKTIGVCGYSGTGSSAVSDLLKEYSQNQVLDTCEFILPYEPDGLMDLFYHLNEGSCKFSSSNTAISRFRGAVRGGQFRYIRELTGGKLIGLSEEFLSKVIQCEWIGSDPADLCNQPIRDLAQRAVRKFHLGKLFYRLERQAGHRSEHLSHGKDVLLFASLEFQRSGSRFCLRGSRCHGADRPL